MEEINEEQICSELSWKKDQLMKMSEKASKGDHQQSKGWGYKFERGYERNFMCILIWTQDPGNSGPFMS